VQAGERRSARVESLRAVAAVGVLVSHAFAYAHGWRPVIFATYGNRSVMALGWCVRLFFALTGYLLYRPFAKRDLADGDGIVGRRYAWNRLVRIAPLYYAVVVILLLVQEHGGTVTQWWRFMLFAQRFSTSTAGAVNPPTWSLVVEVHFYILLPLLAWGVARVARGAAWRAGAVLIALGALSFLLRARHPEPQSLWSYSLPCTFCFFVPGMLLAVLRTTPLETWWSHRRWLGAADLWFVAGVAAWAMIGFDYALEPLVMMASFLLVGAVVLPLRSGTLVRALDWRPLAALGIASYSLYLWHVPVIVNLLDAGWAPTGFPGLLAVGLVVSIAAAAVSYRLIEAPFLRLRRPWARTSPAPEPVVTSTVAGDLAVSPALS
jgi:peptidoglycan/LPS O-acetylase OafA/YrhL